MSKLISYSLTLLVILLIKLCSVNGQQSESGSRVESSSEPKSSLEAEPDTQYETESLCSGEWKSPQHCNTYNCDYKANWQYIDQNDEIMFTISTKNRNKWTGIGFSENQAMPETDAILGLVEESGRFFLMDSWLGAYEAPPLDQTQNLYNMSAWRENGITSLRFFRKRLTGDKGDFQFTDTNCPYLIFPVMGGVFNAVNKRIRKHEITPIISDRKVCIRSCKASTATTIADNSIAKKDSQPTNRDSDESVPKHTSIVPALESTPTPNQPKAKETEDLNDNYYRIELKFPGIWKPSLKHKNSEDYKTMISNIKDQMKNELIRNYPTFTKLNVKELTGVEAEESNSVIASMDLVVKQNYNQKENIETPELLSIALNSIISDEMLGDLRVDPKYLTIARKEEKETEINFFNDEQMKWMIIFVGIAALIGLVLIQAFCMLWRDSRNRESKAKNDKSVPDSQWKDYAAVTASARSGYSYDNYGASDETDSPVKPKAQSFGRHDKLNGSKQNYKNTVQSEKAPQSQSQSQKYLSATLERQPSRSHRTNEFTSAYATHDRKDPYNRNFIQPSFSPQLQPDFYFMPHQRRYSGEVVRVFVDYNNPQFAPK